MIGLMPAPPSTGNHLIVCGDTPLAYRIARELTGRYGEIVVVVLADRTKNHGPRLAALPGVTVVEHARLSGDAFTDAGVATARAAALVGWDDLENFHAALRAQELNPELRLVVSAFNRRLGDHISGFFRDCTVLSSSQLAAPALVAAALGEIAPSHVRVSGRTLYVTRRTDVPAGQVLCGLAVPDDPAGTTQLIAPEDLNGGADLVLAVADGTPRDPLARQRHPVRAALAVGRRLVMNRFGAIFGVLFAFAVAGLVLLAVAGYRVGDVVYLGIMDMTGSALTRPADSVAEKVAQVLLTVDGMAMIPLVTAIIVGARLTGQIRGEPRPRGGHVIVVGGGEVGIRVVGGLHDLGFDVALVDHDPKAPAVAFARNLGLPVVIGDASERTLRRAGLDGAIALVSATNSDIVNLETAMQARAMRGEDLRLVLRLFDDDLAQRVQRTVSNAVSRSVSYLAAPAFAVAMLEHKVLRTIAVGRHVLLLADVRVEPGADIAGRPLADLELGGLARVIALQERGALRFAWSPRRDHRLMAGERMIVLATRAGLSTFLAGNRSPVVSPLSDRGRFFSTFRPIAAELPQRYAIGGIYSNLANCLPGKLV
jgi:Trk K+ transport system NAD-binding subunit